MTFKDILVIYENKIDNAKARLDRGLIEQEEYDIIIRECQYSTEYNKFHKGKVVEIHFNGYLKYTIR